MKNRELLGFEEEMIQGEAVVWYSTQHWMSNFWLWIVWIGLIALCFTGVYGAVFGVLTLLLLMLPLTVSEAVRRQVVYIVTNKRYIERRKRPRAASWSVPLTKVESVSSRQNLRGRIFGYGTIEIHGVGGSRLICLDVRNVSRFLRELQEQIDLVTTPIVYPNLPPISR